jgi:hypothetical protein
MKFGESQVLRWQPEFAVTGQHSILRSYQRREISPKNEPFFGPLLRYWV